MGNDEEGATFKFGDMRTRELQLQVDRLKGTLIERDINWEQKFRERTCR